MIKFLICLNILKMKDNSKNIIIEIFNQRSYTEITEIEDNMISAKDTKGTEIIVIFFKEQKLNTKGMNNIISLLNEKDIKHCIVVYGDDITSATKNTLSRSSDIFFELFTTQELQINITKSKLQPKSFTKISDIEKQEFVDKFGDNIPRLKINKPISKFFNYSIGDIIKIVRQNDHITSRIVTE